MPTGSRTPENTLRVGLPPRGSAVSGAYGRSAPEHARASSHWLWPPVSFSSGGCESGLGEGVEELRPGQLLDERALGGDEALPHWTPVH